MIRVENLVKNYAGFPAVRGISFTVETGEIVGFLGPNGAGKTTTLRILCGYMPATEGEVVIDNLPVTGGSRAVRRRVGYLPEDVPLYRDMTVEGYLGYLAGLKEVPRSRIPAEVDRVVGLAGLESVRKRLIGKCSKGFRQRTGLAMSLLGDPPVLLLDEPTSGLDPNQVVEVRELIRTLGGRRTVLLSSHILSEVAQICGRVLVIHEGRLVGAGAPEDLAGGERFLLVRVRGTLAPEGLRSAPSVEAVEAVGSGSWRLRVSDAEEAAPAVARLVHEAGAELLELRRETADLERVFRRLTGGTDA